MLLVVAKTSIETRVILIKLISGRGKLKMEEQAQLELESVTTQEISRSKEMKSDGKKGSKRLRPLLLLAGHLFRGAQR